MQKQIKDSIFKKGFCDAFVNHKCPDEYDYWPPLVQQLYEYGRLAAVEMKAANLVINDWPDNEPMPRWLRYNLRKMGKFYPGDFG